LTRTGAGFGENVTWDHRSIHLIKLIALTMLSAVVKKQYTSELTVNHSSFLVHMQNSQIFTA